MTQAVTLGALSLQGRGGAQLEEAAPQPGPREFRALAAAKAAYGAVRRGLSRERGVCEPAALGGAGGIERALRQ